MHEKMGFKKFMEKWKEDDRVTRCKNILKPVHSFFIKCIFHEVSEDPLVQYLN